MLEVKCSVFLVRCLSNTVLRQIREQLGGSSTEDIVGVADTEKAAKQLIADTDPKGVYKYEILKVDVWSFPEK